MKLNDFRLPHRYYHFSPLQTDRQILNVRLHLSCIRVNVRVFWTTDEIAVLCVCVCLCEREERTGEGENNKNSHSAVLYLVSAWLKSFPVAPWTLGGFRGLLLWGSFIRFNSYHSFNQQMVWQIKDAEAQRKDKKLNSLFFNLFFTKRRREVQIHKNYNAAKWIKTEAIMMCLQLWCPQRPIISLSVVPPTLCSMLVWRIHMTASL